MSTTLDTLTFSLRVWAENENTVQTATIGDVKDENPVWLDSEQVSKNRTQVARCMFVSHDRADITFAVNLLCQKMSDPTEHSFATELEGREVID